jgi:sugar/nucleoside kinase (ribokinase family)
MSRVVTFGEIMARIATPGFARFQQAMPGGVNVTFAGAEASIAASLAYLGIGVAFVTALPEHAIADACIADLRGLGVETKHILRTPEGRLGIYFLEHGANQRGGNVIYDRDGSSMAITTASAYDWNAIFTGCEWFVISGITPAISRNAAEVALIAVKEAAHSGIKVVCDMNYRTKLWRWEPPLSARELATRTMRELLRHVTVFVGGISDATAMLGIDFNDGDLKALGEADRRRVFPISPTPPSPCVMAAPLPRNASAARFTRLPPTRSTPRRLQHHADHRPPRRGRCLHRRTRLLIPAKLHCHRRHHLRHRSRLPRPFHRRRLQLQHARRDRSPDAR